MLDKPGDAATCRAQLADSAAQTARFHTACAVVGPARACTLAHVDTTTVLFRSLGAEEIERYVEREQPFDCAGGFKAEALGITLFESIESRDPTALIGLPLIWLAGALRGAGYRLALAARRAARGLPLARQGIEHRRPAPPAAAH